jgi:eukaryotic-like serine/threonine-protein kinase
MPLAAGVRLGVYEVSAQIGVGGMGEVYLARDTKLGRDVALKVLPTAFALDAERVARFEREAKALASLNHPHIAALYGMEVAGDQHFLIMELVDGETLAERLSRGPIGVDETLRIAIQIADALEAAHDKGIVHRDLKPANVKITSDDQVKVLDFGLARALETSPVSGTDVTHSPTLSVMATQAGVLLGTAAYMSPEQAKGSPADDRSDIFSFGSLLYEMLTGHQPFQGDGVPEMLASVLAREPDLTALPVNLNPQLTRILQRCFEKVPKRRWQAIADVRAELVWIATSPHPLSGGAAPGDQRKALWRRAAVPVGVALVAAAVAAGTATYMRPTAPAALPTRFSITAPPGETINIGGGPRFAISPDGTHIAYSTSGGLYVRALSEFEGIRIVPVGPTGVIGNPMFSPDGQSVAFADAEALKRIPVHGGTPSTVCGLMPFQGGLSWDSDHILIGGASAIQQVTPSGGTPEDLVPLRQGEFVWGPHMLPGGDWVLFTVAKGITAEDWDEAQIVAQSITSHERRVLVENARDARYLASGHLVFARGGVLFAAPFDAERRALIGAPVPVVDGVERSNINGAAHFSVSRMGSLIYLPGPTGLGERRVELIIADRNGSAEQVPLPPGPYDHPRISPDGRLLTYGTMGQDQNVWVYDLRGAGAPRRLTFGGKNKFPIWSADGRHVAFQSNRDGALAIYWQAADGSGSAERLTEPAEATAHIPDAWLPDGDRFLFSIAKGATRTLWTYSLRDKKSVPFDGVESANSVPRAAAVSPDGRWVVYVAPTAQSPLLRSIFVKPFPATDATYQIGEMGQQPVWSRDGREIIFVPAGGGRLARVRIESGSGLVFSKPTEFQRAFTGNLAPTYERNYDVTPDGRLIGFGAPAQTQNIVSSPQINIVLNWSEELKRLVPAQ